MTSENDATPCAPGTGPAWTEHVIWWHVYPLGFVGADTTGADRTPVRTLRALVPWLDHLVELGANGLALGPIFASSTHGYDTIDWFAIDPRLGDESDLRALLDEAHTRGIRVMLDGVFNHVGRDFPAFRTAEEHPDAPEAALFRRDETGALATFEGHDALVALDHANPAVADLVARVLQHWLERGADAWRLDAAYTVPSAFWAAVLPRVRAAHPEVYVLGEVLHGDYAAAVAEGTLDSVTQYELWQGIWHGIQDTNLNELAWALTRHNGFLDAFVPYTFLGNHDVTRIAAQIDDERHHAHALVLLLTLGGTPALYYGDEYGFRAVKEERVGGDDAIRPAFPADPADLEQTGPDVLALHQRLLGLRRRHPWLHRARSSARQTTDTTMVLELSDGEHGLLVALNIGDGAVDVADAGDILDGMFAGFDGDVLRVGPHGWVIAERAGS